MRYVLSTAMKAGYNAAEMEERCQSTGLSSSRANIIYKRWKDRYREITSSLLSRVMSANRLVDMDWSFGVTVASSDANQVGKTYVQLKLVIDQAGDGPRTHFVELSVDQFYQFLGALESCKQHLDYISSSISS
jgi:COMM domain containing 7